MRLLGQFQTIFFYENISRLQKRKSNENQPIFCPLEVFMRQKLLPLLCFVHLILFCWLVLAWFAFLYVRNFFVKKYWFEIVLITSLSILLISSISLRTSSVYFSKHSLSVSNHDLSISQFVLEILFPNPKRLNLTY